jgi:hypothetical protein
MLPADTQARAVYITFGGSPGEFEDIKKSPATKIGITPTTPSNAAPTH